jgi:hypothetical protein
MRHALLLAVFAAAAVAADLAEEAAPKKEEPPAKKEEPAPGKEEPAPVAFPQLLIANKDLKLTVYLPDIEKGFYRGARFDWSGLVARAEFAGHTVYGPFRTKHDPFGHDSVVGPAEEFDMEVPPPGFQEAQLDEPFLKIGVGLLAKAKDQYQFWARQRFIAPPQWQVTHGADWVAFRQQEAEPRGNAYDYTKRLALPTAGASFTLTHTLKNTGTQPIDTVQYCHNFTVIDGDPVGPNYRVAWPFDLGTPRQSRGKAEVRGRELVFPDELTSGSVWIAFSTGTAGPQDNQVTVENRRTGAAVTIVGDQTPIEWRFYAERTAACPEPFIRLRVAPGEEARWQSGYTFTVTGAAAKEPPKPAAKEPPKPAAK